MWIKTSKGKLFDLNTGNSITIDLVNCQFMVEMVLTTPDLHQAKVNEFDNVCHEYEFDTANCEFSVKVIEAFDYDDDAQAYLDKLAEKLDAEVIDVDSKRKT